MIRYSNHIGSFNRGFNRDAIINPVRFDRRWRWNIRLKLRWLWKELTRERKWAWHS